MRSRCGPGVCGAARRRLRRATTSTTGADQPRPTTPTTATTTPRRRHRRRSATARAASRWSRSATSTSRSTSPSRRRRRRRPLRGRAGRHDRAGPADGGEPNVFLDIGDQVTCGGEQGLLSVAFAPDYAGPGRFYVDYTDTDGDSRMVEYRARPATRRRPTPSSAAELLHDRPTSPPTTTAACCCSGPTATSTSASATAAATATPSAPRQDLGQPARQDPATIDPARQPGGYDARGATGCATRGASRSTADDRRPLDRRRRPGHARGDRRVPRRASSAATQLRLVRVRGRPALQRRPAGARTRSPPVLDVQPRRRLLGDRRLRRPRPRLPTLYGRYLYGDYCAGELRSFTADPARPATDDRAARARGVAQLSSFGEDADGHVYAASLEGPVYRLGRRAEPRQR